MADAKDPVTEEAIDAAGGPAALARFINENYDVPITAQAICDWKQIPPRRVLQVEAATAANGKKIPRQRMAPDLYPTERAKAA